MNITIENKKAKAIELMKKLDIYKPYIKGFEKDNTVCFYENFGGFWAWQEPELMEKIKTFEEKHLFLFWENVEPPLPYYYIAVLSKQTNLML